MDNVYKVTVRVSDGSLSVASDFSLNIANVDEPGTVTIMGTLSGGEELTAAVTDIDGAVSNVTWRWARGGNSIGTFVNIANAASASYTLEAADVGQYLQATASYTDPAGFGQVRRGCDWPDWGRQTPIQHSAATWPHAPCRRTAEWV